MLRYFVGFFAAFSIILAKPVSNDSDDQAIASSSLDLTFQTVNDPESSNFSQDVPFAVGNSNVEINPTNDLTIGCTSEASTEDSQLDDSIQKRGISGINLFCPVVMPQDKRPAVRNKPFRQRPAVPALDTTTPGRACKEPLRRQHVTCGGPEIGESTTEELESVMNCVKGKFFKFFNFFIYNS